MCCDMNDVPENARAVALEKLRAELERSAGDLAAGRVAPLRTVLTEIRERVSQRIERKRQTEGRKQTPPG